MLSLLLTDGKILGFKSFSGKKQRREKKSVKTGGKRTLFRDEFDFAFGGPNPPDHEEFQSKFIVGRET